MPKNTRLGTPGLEWLRDMLLKDPAAQKKLAAVPKVAGWLKVCAERPAARAARQLQRE